MAADEPTPQHYRIATGKGLEPAPNPKPSPGYKKGGKVMAKKRSSGRGK